jgi:hypothetical protein
MWGSWKRSWKYFFAIEVLCHQAHHIRGEGSVTRIIIIIIILLNYVMHGARIIGKGRVTNSWVCRNGNVEDIIILGIFKSLFHASRHEKSSITNLVGHNFVRFEKVMTYQSFQGYTIISVWILNARLKFI